MELDRKSSWRVEQAPHVRISRLLLHKGYTKLDSAGAGGDEDESSRTRSNAVSSSSGTGKKQRLKWRFRVRPPRVRVLYSTISTLVRRLRDSYARLMLALAAKARDSSLLFPPAYKKLTRTETASSSRSKEAFPLNDMERKYLEYIKRTVADGEFAFYTSSFRGTSLV